MSKVYGKNKSNSVFKRCLFCTSVYLVLIIIGCAVVAGLVGGEVISIEESNYGIALTMFVSVFIITKMLAKIEILNSLVILIATTAVSTLILMLGNFCLGCLDMTGLFPSVLITTGGAAGSLLLKRNNRRKFAK